MLAFYPLGSVGSGKAHSYSVELGYMSSEDVAWSLLILAFRPFLSLFTNCGFCNCYDVISSDQLVERNVTVLSACCKIKTLTALSHLLTPAYNKYIHFPYKEEVRPLYGRSGVELYCC